MTSSVTTHSEGKVARPLRVLVPLIKEDFVQAEQAGMPYFEAAGAKLNEAREAHFDGNTVGFYQWAARNFQKSVSQIRLYMRLAAARSDKPRKAFKTLDDFQRSTGVDRSGSSSGPRRDYIPDVDAVSQRARDEARRLALEDNLTRQQEREADHQLALRLIDIGYKVLAKELHPDKGGSRDAMQRLGRVRDRLKQCI